MFLVTIVEHKALKICGINHFVSKEDIFNLILERVTKLKESTVASGMTLKITMKSELIN